METNIVYCTFYGVKRDCNMYLSFKLHSITQHKTNGSLKVLKLGPFPIKINGQSAFQLVFRKIDEICVTIPFHGTDIFDTAGCKNQIRPY